VESEPEIWDRRRTPAALLALITVAERRGISPRACLAGTGLHPADLQSAGLTVFGYQELTAVRNLVRLTSDEPGLGAAAGAMARLGALGIYGFALQSSPTVRELTAAAVRHGYGKFTWGMLRPTLTESPDSTLGVFDEHCVPEDVRSFVIERDLAFTATVITEALGAYCALAVESTLPAARAEELRRRFPSMAVAPDRDRNAIRFSEATLAQPLPAGDVVAFRTCERQCEDLLDRWMQCAQQETVARQVTSTLLGLSPDRWTLRDVADARAIHPRTLNRRLAAEGSSFRGIIDGIRRSLASALLSETDLTVTQVASRVGYADGGSFLRAYKRWTGDSPGGASPSDPELSRR
jgi:AraC-like DNA-binding protein